MIELQHLRFTNPSKFEANERLALQNNLLCQSIRESSPANPLVVDLPYKTFPMSAKSPTASSNENSELLKSWVEEHSDYLFRYTRKYFREESVCEDLVQEAFLAAVQAIKNFEGKSTPRTWLTGILRHKILDRIRKNSKDAPLNMQPLEDQDLGDLFDQNEHWTVEAGPVPWSTQPDTVFEQKQFMGALQNCLKKVPEKYRQVFILREVEGYSREEICEKVGLTNTNIGVVLHRVRLGLQNCLQTNWLPAAVKGRNA